MDYIQEVNAMIGKYDDLMRSAWLAETMAEENRRRADADPYGMHWGGGTWGEVADNCAQRAEMLRSAALDTLEAAGDFICKVEGIHG